MTSDGKETNDPPGYRDMTWAQAAGQREVSAHLERLPTGIDFGDTFPEPIFFDAVKRELRYRGLMYHGSYAYLRDQSRDIKYLLAVDQLYMLSSQPESKSHIKGLVSALTAGLAAAALFSGWKLMH